MSLAKNWVFTLNNYLIDDVDRIKELVSEKKANYVVFQEEQGEEGTPHLQGRL